MKQLVLSILQLFIFCSVGFSQFNSKTIIQKSIKYHDPQNKWETANLNLHIQEPRLKNPHRYSIIHLNNQNKHFKFIRNKNEKVLTYIVDKNDSCSLLIDNKANTELARQLKLNPSKAKRYKRFYSFMYGLPMIIFSNEVKKHSIIEKTEFNEVICYKIRIELNEPLISKSWNVYISEKDHHIKGLEIISNEDKNSIERIYFDKEIIASQMKLPRMRHWYKLPENQYRGSDMVIKEM